MKKVVFAGCGTLVEQLIRAVLPSTSVTTVVLSERMSDSNISKMKVFCKSYGIPCQFGYEGAKGDAFLTPNYPELLEDGFLKDHLCINVHFALLPKYRGFHPVQCALLNDEPVVGYTVHRVDTGIDSGPVYFQEQVAISDDDTIHTLNARLSDSLVKNFANYLAAIFNGRVAVPQDESNASWCGRRHAYDGLIDWHDKSRYIFNLIRAVSPPYYPGAYTYWKNRKVIVTKADEHHVSAYRHIPGQVVNVQTGKGLLVKTGDSLLWINRVQLDEYEGPAEEIIGHRIGLRFCSSVL